MENISAMSANTTNEAALKQEVGGIGNLLSSWYFSILHTSAMVCSEYHGSIFVQLRELKFYMKVVTCGYLVPSSFLHNVYKASSFKSDLTELCPDWRTD